MKHGLEERQKGWERGKHKIIVEGSVMSGPVSKGNWALSHDGLNLSDLKFAKIFSYPGG